MSIAEAVKKDIVDRFNSSEILSVYKEIGRNYRQSIRDNNASRSPINPDGSGRQPLSNTEPFFYASTKLEKKGNAIPNLIYDGIAQASLGIFEDNTGFKMYHTDNEADSYMYKHETGTGRMPMRRQFPTDEDSKTQNQKPNIIFTEGQLGTFLNAPRTIRVTTRLKVNG